MYKLRCSDIGLYSIADNMSTPDFTLVTTSWLNQQLSAAGSQLCLLDATWTPTGEGYKLYLGKHIPGARYYNLDSCITPRPTCARELPDPDCYQKYLRNFGINDVTHVVIYDRSIWHATKAWWTLKTYGHDRVSVLDGGLFKWEADGYNVTSGEEASTAEIGNLEVNVVNARIAEFDDILKVVGDRSAQIVDVRAEKHFNGLEMEPCLTVREGLQSMSMPVPETMKRGHVPGALNLWRDLLLDPDTKCFLTKDKLLELFSEYKSYITRQTITMCYIGHTATIFNMAALLCGQVDTTRLYHGSWTEYGQLANDDVVAR